MAKRNRREDRLSYEGVMDELCRLTDSEEGVQRLAESSLMVSGPTLNHMDKDNKEECEITDNQQTLVDYLLNPGCNAVYAVLCAYICLSIILVYYGVSAGKSVNLSMKRFFQVVTLIICKTCHLLK